MFQLKWVWKHLQGVRKRYIFALCSTAVLSVMALGNSMITATIMDTVFQPLTDSGVVTDEVVHHLIFLWRCSSGSPCSAPASSTCPS